MSGEYIGGEKTKLWFFDIQIFDLIAFKLTTQVYKPNFKAF